MGLSHGGHDDLCPQEFAICLCDFIEIVRADEREKRKR